MQRQLYTRENWEALKSVIKSLYIDEDKPCKRVLGILQTKFNFHATRRQFTRQISEWGMRKYMKDSEMRACVHRLSHGEFDEKDNVLIPKMRRWQKRYRRMEVDLRPSPRRPIAVSPLDGPSNPTVSIELPVLTLGNSTLISIESNSASPAVLVKCPQAADGDQHVQTLDIAQSHKLSNFFRALGIDLVGEITFTSPYRPEYGISPFPMPLANRSKVTRTLGAPPLNALSMQMQGNEKGCRHRLYTLEKIFGPEGDETLKVKAELAAIYWGACKYRLAEESYLQVAKSREQTLGLSHPDTLSVYLKVVRAVIFRGGYREAEKIHQDIHATIIGLGDPETELALESTSLMGDILYYLEQDAEADNLRRQVLQIRLNNQKEWSASTLMAMGKVASILADSDKLLESEILLQNIVQLHHEVKDISEEAILNDARQLAEVLRHQGKHKESETWFRQIVERSKTSLGPDHLETLSCYSGLAYCLSRQNLYQESERLLRTTVDQQLKLLGDRDAETVFTMHGLANVFEKTQRHLEALTLREMIFNGAIERYGRSHERTVWRCQELGKCYEALGRLGDALSLYQRFAAELRKVEDGEQPMLAKVGGWMARLQELLAKGKGEDERRENLGVQEYLSGEENAVEETEGDDDKEDGGYDSSVDDEDTTGMEDV